MAPSAGTASRSSKRLLINSERRCPHFLIMVLLMVHCLRRVAVLKTISMVKRRSTRLPRAGPARERLQVSADSF